MTKLRIGTRGSALALAQAETVARALATRGIEHEVVVIETAGDRRAPDTAWGEGAFVTAIERALVDRRVDVAVHSAKDIPTDEDPRLVIAAFLPREEPRDALVVRGDRSHSLDELPPGTVVGTDSPRRTGFIRAHRRDLKVKPLHGNVDTRLRRLDEGVVDALVLAAAGLNRLGRAERISQILPVEVVPPAPGQGAIAVQVRTDDEETRRVVRRVDDVATRHAVETERTLLTATGGGCRAPVGALAVIDGAAITLVAGFATLDGSLSVVERVSGPIRERERLAETLAEQLVSTRASRAAGPRVLVTRPRADARRLVGRLAEHGVSAVVVPTIEVELLETADELVDAVRRLHDYDWAVVTSANAVRAIVSAARAAGADLSRTRWAAVGRAAARELMAAGVGDVWMPSAANALTLAEELPVSAGERMLWPSGDLAENDFAARLQDRGARVDRVTAYRTLEGPESSRAALSAALGDGAVDAVILASPSAARGLVALAGRENRDRVMAIPAICVGRRTASAAVGLGFSVLGSADAPDATVVAELAADLLAQPNSSHDTVGVRD